MNWSVFAILTSPIITIVAGFFIFERQQRWTKKIEIYEETTELLGKIAKKNQDNEADIRELVSKEDYSFMSNELRLIQDEIDRFKTRAPIYKIFISKDSYLLIEEIFSKSKTYSEEIQKVLKNDEDKYLSAKEKLKAANSKMNDFNQYLSSSENLLRARIELDTNIMARISLIPSKVIIKKNTLLGKKTVLK
ncbi:hypothetical protein [Kushneria phyllosphaerae]|uniref:Uncharacterized protein n=1 Tax=Kushneria phyllosphaerae TaxID=2100822 RepID=A0A2R8CIG2_9GAMM|nr:hypothetical protein [Kushneria phyllosphaerae]SPJ32699.1 hypothetical protein KSP9073_00700 [Kushneria phyllosphaerae]